MTWIKRCGSRWRRGLLAGVPSSVRRSVASQTRLGWPIVRRWGGTGACVSTGVLGASARGPVRAPSIVGLCRPGRRFAGLMVT
jgi:hypothetical protein